MLELTVDKYGYLTIDSESWLDDFSTVSETWTNAFRAYAEMRAQSYGDSYVSGDMVREWAESLGSASGIYGEDGPVTVATCNVDSFLSDDVTFTFLYVTAQRTDANGDTEEWTHPLIVTHGSGYMASTAAYCEVREFHGDDDADAFSYASGYAAHSTKSDCVDWIIENACTLWPNGGQGDTFRIDECITEDEDTGLGILSCPLCGDRLTPYVS